MTVIGDYRRPLSKNAFTLVSLSRKSGKQRDEKKEGNGVGIL